MTGVVDAGARPPMPYYGGKQRIAQRIVALFPSHLHYVEPFAGGLSVLMAKGPSMLETVNDLDHQLVTFWRVLRDRPQDLMWVCEMTPHSRRELELCREPMDGLEELEVARRVWSQLVQGRAGRRTRTGWRYYIDRTATGATMATYLRGYLDRMMPAAARLASVQLECLPALQIIERYGTAPQVLFYVDPPYLASTRRSQHYVHELSTDAQHVELAEALKATNASVVLSGYHSALYDRLYGDWATVEIAASTQQSSRDAPHRSAVDELLPRRPASPRPAPARRRPRQGVRPMLPGGCSRWVAGWMVVSTSAALVALTGCQWSAEAPRDTSLRVVWVSDGDTFVAVSADGVDVRVRLLGVDAPEVAHQQKPAQCGAERARDELGQLLGNHLVELRTDPRVQSVDRYGRLLRYATVDGKDVGLALIEAGMVAAWYPSGRVPPSGAADYLAAQLKARSGRVGSWASCSTLGR